MANNNFSIPILIEKKRNGGCLTNDEITHFIHSVVHDEVQGAQIGAMLMAIFYKGMNSDETVTLTRSMKESGDSLTWPPEWESQKLLVDKHSTGGVGDKVSIPLAPALAACGLKVPMISGRGLGFTGGTLDKLESIPGYTVKKTPQEITQILQDVGCCIVGQTDTMVPADRILYATRDITATVDCRCLVVASILSKKVAENLSSLVLDVKYGRGSFTKTEEDARMLAEQLVAVACGLGVPTTALLTNMNCPLGRTVGNALEIMEAIKILQGKGPEPITNLIVDLGAHLLVSSGKARDIQEGQELLKKTYKDGSALAKFKAMIIGQGTPEDVAENLCNENNDPLSILPAARYKTSLKSDNGGYVHDLDAMVCARVCGALGAGRTKAGQDVDHAVGLELMVDIGSHINPGDTWVIVHHSTEHLSADHIKNLQHAFVVKDTPIITHHNLVKDTIRNKSI